MDALHFRLGPVATSLRARWFENGYQTRKRHRPGGACLPLPGRIIRTSALTKILPSSAPGATERPRPRCSNRWKLLFRERIDIYNDKSRSLPSSAAGEYSGKFLLEHFRQGYSHKRRSNTIYMAILV